MKIRILLADDHKIVRDGLRSLIEKQSHMEVVGEAENGRATLNLVRELRPDIVVMDITMPDLNGIEATHQIRTDYPDAKVIALSMHSDRRFVTEMLKAGASGYLLKDCAFTDLASAIDFVLKGQVYMSPGIAGIVVQDYVHYLRGTASSISPLLTAKEREVLQLLAEGKSSKQIAVKLSLSTKTVETHRRHIMDKLNIDNIVDLTKYAIREGLVSVET